MMDGMAQQQAGSSDPRRGILGRVTAIVYWLLVVEVCFLLAAAPGFIGIILLERDRSNLPLFALCLVPVAPAFSAAMYTLRIRMREDDLVVWPRYWRGWAANVLDVLKTWIPALAILTVLGVNLLFGGDAGVDGILLGVSVAVSVLVAMWATNAMVIGTFFRFRLRDTARLALYYLGGKPLVMLGTFSFLVIVGAIVAFTSDWVAALAGSVLAAFLLATVRPMLTDIEERFTASGDAPASGDDTGPAPSGRGQ